MRSVLSLLKKSVKMCETNEKVWTHLQEKTSAVPRGWWARTSTDTSLWQHNKLHTLMKTMWYGWKFQKKVTSWPWGCFVKIGPQGQEWTLTQCSSRCVRICSVPFDAVYVFSKLWRCFFYLFVFCLFGCVFLNFSALCSFCRCIWCHSE